MMPNGVWGRTWYTLSCLVAGLALVASGLSYVLVRDVSSIGDSHAITSGASTGPQNILLMGLESRRDWNGNILPGSILAKLHSGNAHQVANGTGGNATNTPSTEPGSVLDSTVASMPSAAQPITRKTPSRPGREPHGPGVRPVKGDGEAGRG